MSRNGGLRGAVRRARQLIDDRRATTRLVSENPWMRDVVERIEHSRRSLKPRHTQYTNFVSNPGHALSLESSALIHALCHSMRPHRVIDLGSGFSSYVLRHYQAEVDDEVVVRSVDDSPEWLERTRDYLLEKKLSTDNLVALGDIGPSDAGAYDLVVYDLGSMDTRSRWLSAALGLPRPSSGIMIVDDCHFDDFRANLIANVQDLGGRCIDLQCITRDHFGRFESLVTSLPPRESVET